LKPLEYTLFSDLLNPDHNISRNDGREHFVPRVMKM